MARKKRRFEQLEAAAAEPKEKKIYTNPLQQKVDERLEDVGKKFEGKGRTLLYGVGAFIVLAILVFVFMRWTRTSNAEAQTALGKAIETAQTPVTEAEVQAGSTQKTFKTQRERAEASVTQFQAVADKFGGAVGEKAKYFIAVNRLDIDRPAGIQELEALAGDSSPAGRLAKFALAQTRVGDNRLDEALTLFQELAGLENAVVAKETINFELAKIYEKQDKKKEAADVYYNIAKAGSEVKDLDGKPVKMTETANNAKKKLTELDPERAKEIVDPVPAPPPGGAPPMRMQQ